MWLADEAKALSSIDPVVLYAKVDEANFYNLYPQLMEGLTKEKLQRFLGLALTSIAVEQVGDAKATESMRPRIKGPEDLPKLYAEENLARDQLYQTLQRKLEETKVPVEIPRTLLQIDSPTHGQKAYDWLLGNSVAPIEELALGHNLLEIKDRGKAVPDVTTVNAIETVAAVLNLAESPLIVLIDQMEVLFRVEDKERRQTLFSVIKKLIEHLQRQNALLFIAGSNDTWEEFSRDITPRLRSRQLLSVGSLSVEETEIFLDSFTEQEQIEGFADTSIGRIHQLSGGNPREILRIAHHAFKAVEGKPREVTDTILMRSASESGSIADRQLLAQSIADKVLSEFGAPLKGLEEGGAVIDFLLIVERVPCLALVTAKATDKLSEVTSARRIQAVRGYIKDKWPTAQLLVVSVGYSSSEIEGLLSTTSTVMQFDERQFSHQLRAKTAEIVTHATLRRSDGDSKASQKIGEALNKIAARLDQLDTKRAEEAEKRAERFSEKADELARPETKKRELRSRFEMLDELDALQETLLKGWENWQPGPLSVDRSKDERQRIRSILISNENDLKIDYLEQVGGLYQELLAEESGFRKELDSFQWEKQKRGEYDSAFPNFANIARDEKARDPRWILSELLRARLDLIKIMRRLLQEPRMLDKWLERPLLYAFVPTGIMTGLQLLLIWWNVLNSNYYEYEIAKYGILGLVVFNIFAVMFLSFFMSLFLLFFFRWARVRGWHGNAERVKRMIRIYQRTASQAST
jgi:hypothetical protein